MTETEREEWLAECYHLTPAEAKWAAAQLSLGKSLTETLQALQAMQRQVSHD